MTDNSLDLSSYPRWSTSCIWKSQDDGLFIVHITSGDTRDAVHTVQHIVLNREGKDVWMLCTGEHTITDIVTILENEYEGDELAIEKDVVDMITQMVEQTYIVLEKYPVKAVHGLDQKLYPKRKDDVIVNTVEGKFVLMNMVTSEVHSFDLPVKNLWDICDGTRSVGEIVSTAANTDEAQFLLGFLVKLGFLELLNG